MPLDDPERQALAAAGLAVFADRVIHDAQAPADPAIVERIEDACGGPLPEGLQALWAQCLGGRLGYDVSVVIGGRVATLSFTELFHPGSDGHRDLFGWIEHQLELEQDAAAAAGLPWNGRLGLLPIGGSEYLDRVYVEVAPGPDHGSVWVWMPGLAPAWRMRLQHDVSARVAPDLPTFFRSLVLHDDPFASASDASASAELVAAIADLAARGGAAATAAEHLRTLLRAAWVDLPAAIADGRVADDPRLRRLAWTRACDDGDPDLARALLDLGCDPNERLAGGGRVLDHALARGVIAVAEVVLERAEVEVGDAIRHGVRFLDPRLARTLVARGATVDADVLGDVPIGSRDVAAVLVQALGRRSKAARDAVATLRARAAAEDARARALGEPDPFAARTPADHLARAAWLRELAALLAARTG